MNTVEELEQEYQEAKARLERAEEAVDEAVDKLDDAEGVFKNAWREWQRVVKEGKA